MEKGLVECVSREFVIHEYTKEKVILCNAPSNLCYCLGKITFYKGRHRNICDYDSTNEEVTRFFQEEVVQEEPTPTQL